MSQCGQHVPTVERRQGEIEHDRVERLRPEPREGALSVGYDRPLDVVDGGALLHHEHAR
jgi:hypothetical protein